MQGAMSLGAPMSPRQNPRELGSAAMRWCCSRRGRWLVMVTVMFGIFLALTAMKHQEAPSSPYRMLSAHHSWQPYLTEQPSIIHSRFETPSETTLETESGVVDNVPPKLKKTTPNYHLMMLSERDTDEFCKTTMSAMLTDYPSPTVINLKDELKSDTEWELNNLNSTLRYLSNKSLVKDEDLVLIVDGQQSWFQLPSDVIVTQYKKLLEDANLRLKDRYGVNAFGHQRFHETIVFGAEKMCVGEDMACKYVPDSILPSDMYGKGEGQQIADKPAKFINSKMVIGPAKDLRTLYEAALTQFISGKSELQTVQSVFATMFGEQQLRRDAVESKPVISKLGDLFGGWNNSHEFSIGLDYLHILFQPLLYCTEDELIVAKHDKSIDLSVYRHPGSVYERLSLPAALNSTHPPFWRPESTKPSTSDNQHPANIDILRFDAELDNLPKPKTHWRKVGLIQNTYTGAVPAILFNNKPLQLDAENLPTANVTWEDLWYFPYRRALLRKYFRMPQLPVEYHNSVTGGDRIWSTCGGRGGHGGVWTASTAMWYRWGEADGVCGTLKQIEKVFDDGWGVWKHERQEHNDADRIAEERQVIKDEKEREERWQKFLEKQKEEKEKKEQEEKERKQQEEQKQQEEKKQQEEQKQQEEKKQRKR